MQKNKTGEMKVKLQGLRLWAQIHRFAAIFLLDGQGHPYQLFTLTEPRFFPSGLCAGFLTPMIFVLLKTLVIHND